MKTRFQKFMSLIVAAMLVFGLMGGFADVKSVSAAESAKVYVTISDNTGKQVVRQQSVVVKDIDGDNALTINDALYCAHDKYYKNGKAEAGYGYADGDWGLYITKLWGDESGWFGYFKNSEYSMGLGDPVADGDYLDAYCYSDADNHSDKFSYFEKRIIEVHRKKNVTLNLNYVDFDENFSPVVKPLAKAKIIDGSKETAFKTSKKGKVKVSFENVGSHLITASAPDGMTIVGPACIIYVLPNNGNRIKKDGIEYTIVKVGSVLKNKKGKVTYNVEDLEEGQKAPKTIEIGGITYKVKKAK